MTIDIKDRRPCKTNARYADKGEVGGSSHPGPPFKSGAFSVVEGLCPVLCPARFRDGLCNGELLMG